MADAHLFADFAPDGGLHRLPRFDETGQAGVHAARPAGVSGQQGPPVVALDQHDHGRSQPGKGEQSAAGAAPGPLAG